MLGQFTAVAGILLGLFLLGLIVVIVWLARQLVSARHGPAPASAGASSGPAASVRAPRTPRKTLDHRLASGEITIEEYRVLLGELSRGAAPDEVDPRGSR